MKLSNTITIKLKAGDETITFDLRRPTNQELNDFQAKRIEVDPQGRKLKDNSNEAREELFDKILLSVENLEDDIGIITVARKDAIPSLWKQDIIYTKIENEVRIDTKN